MAAHGINAVLVYLDGGNTGWPNSWIQHRGLGPDGALDAVAAERLEWLIREADQRGMVVGVGLFTNRTASLLAQADGTKAIDEAAAKPLGRPAVTDALMPPGAQSLFSVIYRRWLHDRRRGPRHWRGGATGSCPWRESNATRDAT